MYRKYNNKRIIALATLLVLFSGSIFFCHLAVLPGIALAAQALPEPANDVVTTNNSMDNCQESNQTHDSIPAPVPVTRQQQNNNNLLPCCYQKNEPSQTNPQELRVGERVVVMFLSTVTEKDQFFKPISLLSINDPPLLIIDHLETIAKRE